MIILKESLEGNRSIFKRIHANSHGKVVFEETIYYRLYKISNNSANTLILYDDQMNAISSVYRFINNKMASLSYNSREKAIYAIRLLYCYLSLTKTKLTNLKSSDIEKLKYFLLGYSPDQGAFSLQLQTIRSNATVNGYLSIYRSYLRYLEIDCDYLFETKVSNDFHINPNTERTEKLTTYRSNLKTSTPGKRVPKYISVSEFEVIINIIREDNNLLAECIVRLMYQYGLRLGETLGLTFEDLTEIKLGEALVPVLYIRNRLSDKHFQHAKTCLNVMNSKQYRTKDYRTENVGYQKIIITYDVYELINEYIDLFHMKAREHNLTRYNQSVKADNVSKGKYSTDNYYIFINSQGKILSEQTWNKYIKTVFERAGIQIDKEIKENGLNHRFRHGFAMFHVKYRKTPILELQKLMRHAVISSTMIYYNPTEEDEVSIKNEFVNELYDLIPALKENYAYAY